MRITPKQKEILDSLIVERLRDNPTENASLVNTFANKKNPNLENIITSSKAFDSDSNGSTAYYIVKANTGELLLYFSLKCGELFKALDLRKMELAGRVINVTNILINKEIHSEDELKSAESFLRENLDEISALLPELSNYIGKKDHYLADINKELNKQMRRVLKTYPAIEIVEFCANDNSRAIWQSLGLNKKLGECVFWHHIVPKLLSIQDIVGCQYVYLFAADASIDGNLTNYYKVTLHFDDSLKLGANKPHYDFKCTFLCQEIKNLIAGRDSFYNHFNPDPEGDERV